MSIKVISLILIAFLARNCYKYIINYKSVDFDNSYITPMFMRKVGVDKKNFWFQKIDWKNSPIPCLRMLEENGREKLLFFLSGIILLLRNSRDIMRFSDSSKKLNICHFGHRKWQQHRDEVLSCRQDRLRVFIVILQLLRNSERTESHIYLRLYYKDWTLRGW